MLAHNDALADSAIANLSSAFGTDRDQTRKAVDSVLSSLTTRMMAAASSRSGLADIVEIIGAPGRESYLQPGTALNDPQVQADGIGILSQLVGSRDKSRALAASAARESGLSDAAIKAMLPSIAAVAMGALSKRTSAAFGDILKIPGLDEIAREARDDMGGGGQLAPPQYGSPLPLPGEPPRRYSPTPPADWSAGNGQQQAPAQPRKPANPAPGGGGMRQQSPLPIPGDDVPGMGRHEDNPYGDLSDILRRGGFRIPGGNSWSPNSPRGGSPLPDGVPAGQGGDLLSNIIRNILGSVLGTGGRGSGLIGWIIRLIVVRYGSSIVRAILRRFLRINV